MPASLRPFLAELWRFDHRALGVALCLNLTVALLEGVGLMLLLPLLTLAGIFGPTKEAAAFTSAPRFLTRWLSEMVPDWLLPLMLAVFVVIIALQSGLTLLRERQSFELRLRFVDHLRGTLFGALTKAAWGFLSRHHSSTFLSVLTSDVQRVGIGTLFLLQLFTQLALFIVYLLVAFKLSPMASTLAALTAGISWGVLRNSPDIAKQGGIALSQATQSFFNETQEFLGALKFIKLHGEEANYQRQFARVVDHLRERQIEFNEAGSRSRMVYRINGALSLAVLTYVSLKLVHLPAASLLVLIVAFARLATQISQIHANLQQIWHMVPAFNNWRYWVDLCISEIDTLNNNFAPVSLRQGLHFRDVTYRHPKSNHTLHVPELFLPAHQTVAIVGPTGSGKTTLLDLISGLNTPDTGVIEIDGVPMTSYSGWHHRISYIPQETVILDGTIRENLIWGTSGLSDAEIWEALDQAAAATFVRKLPETWNTWVGERGVRLSGGEKQRLALARALLRKPDLLILDEATNALDFEHQQIIFATLRRLHGKMTVLVATHRHEEISDFIDEVVRVNGGIVSRG